MKRTPYDLIQYDLVLRRYQKWAEVQRRTMAFETCLIFVRNRDKRSRKESQADQGVKRLQSHGKNLEIDH